jgi:hypothetical protein
LWFIDIGRTPVLLSLALSIRRYAEAERPVGNGIRGALVLAADHPMTPAVVRPALRAPGSLAMSMVAPVAKLERADGSATIIHVWFDAKNVERCRVDVVPRAACSSTLFD